MTAANLGEARRLLGAGLWLVEMKPYSKQPAGDHWNLLEHRVSKINPKATGYGLLLAQNKLCSLDPDSVEHARIGMRALGFDLDELMDAGVRTRSTRRGSGGRSTFAAEGDLSWLTFRSAATGTVIEFRADSPNLQDTIPGIVYRDKEGNLCRQDYANGRRLDDAPPLPDALCAWWLRCSQDIEFLRSQEAAFFKAIGAAPMHSISTGKGASLAFSAPDHRAAYNRTHKVEELLERHGYSWDRRTERWAPPTATGAPGVRPIPGKDDLWRSDHASDPLHGTFDAWIAHVVLDHQGDLEAAKAALDEASQPPPPEPDDPGFAPEDDYADASTTSHGTDSAAPAKRSGIVLRHLAEIVAEKREPEWLLYKILERRVLAVLAGPRSTFKSFVALDWSMRGALAGFPVAILSAEGGGLDRRADAWMRIHGNGRRLADLPVLALERQLSLNVPSVLGELQLAFDAADFQPALIVVDTLSKYAAGVEESDNTAIAAFLTSLAVELRDKYGCTVLVVAHSGHGNQKRPRGAYALMANPDSEFIVERPDTTAMLVTVSRERFKDGPALEPLAYEAKVVDLERTDQYGDSVTSLALHLVGAPTPKVQAHGKNQQSALVAIREWLRVNPDANHIESMTMRDLLKAQKIPRQRHIEILNWLVNGRCITASVGGYTVHREVIP